MLWTPASAGVTGERAFSTVSKNELEGLRSFRVKKYRVIYRIGVKKELQIVAIGRRRKIYEETFRIIKKEQKQNL